MSIFFKCRPRFIEASGPENHNDVSEKLASVNLNTASYHCNTESATCEKGDHITHEYGGFTEFECQRTCRSSEDIEMYKRCAKMVGDELIERAGDPKYASKEAYRDFSYPFRLVVGTKNTEIDFLVNGSYTPGDEKSPGNFSAKFMHNGLVFKIGASSSKDEEVFVQMDSFFHKDEEEYDPEAENLKPQDLFVLADTLALSLAMSYSKNMIRIRLTDAHYKKLMLESDRDDQDSHIVEVATRLWLLLKRGYSYYGGRGYSFKGRSEFPENRETYLKDTFYEIREKLHREYENPDTFYMTDMIEGFQHDMKGVSRDRTLGELVDAVTGGDGMKVGNMLRYDLFPDNRDVRLEYLWDIVEFDVMRVYGLDPESDDYGQNRTGEKLIDLTSNPTDAMYFSEFSFVPDAPNLEDRISKRARTQRVRYDFKAFAVEEDAPCPEEV